MKGIIVAGSGLALVLAFILGASYYRSWRTERLGFMAQERAPTFVRPHAPRLGPPDARVYVVEFTDPACETCASFSPYLQQAVDAFPGKVQVVLRYAPFHAGSHDVVRILEAARMQDRLWETLHLLYRTQRSWTRNHRVELDRVWPLLPEAGVDVERIRADMRDPRVDAVLQQDQADAAVLGVRRTPGFFVNGKPLEPFGERRLAELIEAEVSASYPE